MDQDQDLELLRKKKLQEMQQNLAQERGETETEKQLELQKQSLLRKLLTQEARQRLANLKMVRPDFASQLELQLVQLAQQRQIRLPIDDDQLKEILRKLQGSHKDIRIRRV